MFIASRSLALVALCGLSSAVATVEPSEDSLRAADAEQMRIIVEGDPVPPPTAV
jgi:hypothetical protein